MGRTARPMICRTVGVSASAEEELAVLTHRLDLAYRETAARVPTNAAVEIVGVGEKVDLSVEALDKVDEPATLTALRAAVDARLPKLDLPELILEMHARTGLCNALHPCKRERLKSGGHCNDCLRGIARRGHQHRLRTFGSRRCPGASPVPAELGQAELHPCRDP